MAFLSSAEYEKLKEKKKDSVADEKHAMSDLFVRKANPTDSNPDLSNPELFDENGVQSVF